YVIQHNTLSTIMLIIHLPRPLRYRLFPYTTLFRSMVELTDGVTILPELAVAELTKNQQRQLKHFRRPAPMREVSIVVHRDFMKKTLIEILKKEILEGIPEEIRRNRNGMVVPVGLSLSVNR